MGIITKTQQNLSPEDSKAFEAVTAEQEGKVCRKTMTMGDDCTHTMLTSTPRKTDYGTEKVVVALQTMTSE